MLISSRIVIVVLALVAGSTVHGFEINNKTLSDPTDGKNWPSYGRTYDEGHYSPLSDINSANVKRLGLAWFLDLDVANSITVPLEIDGTIYLAAGQSLVHAIDVSSGRLMWRYDPKAAAAAGTKLRGGWGIRGLAFYKGKLYVGTQDGRLICLDAQGGKPLWSVQTVDADGVFISGAPRVFNDKVIIGQGGADFVPMRGYVTAYDANSGKKLWRFYFVPGKPGQPDHEVSDPAMETAAKTWTGEWWKYGGGGAVWNAITYDPDLNRLYIGTGNSGPYNEQIRNPQHGDNLFIASLVALDADTGRYLWHYQHTPNDIWDYNSSQDITLATLKIDGRPRRVILQAPKNGFFYVIDRDTGKLLSAEKLGTVTWADRVDMSTGRPVETPIARYGEKPVVISPSIQGLHHWTTQSFSPLTGLVYVPTIEFPGLFARGSAKTFNPILYSPDFTGLSLPDGDIGANAGKSILKAWNPLTQKAAWSVETRGISNGGTMATGGNLVFQGLADGHFHAYTADKGQDAWDFYAGVAATGVPITYKVHGIQYISLTTGPLNGATAGFGSISAQWGWDSRLHPRRLLTFKLDGTDTLPAAPPPTIAKPLEAPEFALDRNLAVAGAHQYLRCMICHGPAAVAGGTAPDLRASGVPLSMSAFSAVVRGGALVDRGMPKFGELTDLQLQQLQNYIRAKARGMDLSNEKP